MHSDKINIKAYSLLAVAFLRGNNVLGEIIYTDIEPDLTIDIPGQTFLLDLNGDGEADFNFIFTSTNFAYFTYWGGINFYQLNAILALPQNSNEIAAFTGAGGAYVYPYVIDEGIDIGPVTGNFSNKSVQTMAYQFYAIIQSYFYYPLYIAGDWVFGETKKYVGLELHANDSIYYGWLRLDVAINNRSFTLRDFAYETIAESAIPTFIPVPVVNMQPTIDCNIYTQDALIYIALSTSVAEAVTASVFDISGRQVLTAPLQTGANTLSLEFCPSGNYIVQLQTATSTYAQQVWLK